MIDEHAPQPTKPAIVLENISKQYGPLTAVAELNLTVNQGEILGFLGPNGAGKTTTIRLLTGFLKPSSGRVQLLGHDMAQRNGRAAALQQLGFVPDSTGLDGTITGARLLSELAQLQGQPPIDQTHLIDALELNRHDLKRPLGQLSRGTRQKINLIQGLQHRPELLILDEPTEGLDPLTKRAFFTILREAQARGATIFFSSHILSEVEALCDRVALIRRGRLVAVENLNQLRRTLQRQVELHLAEIISPTEVERRLLTLPTISQLTHNGRVWRFTISDLPPLLALLTEIPVTDLTITPSTLEEIFMRYYQQNQQNEQAADV